MVGVSPQLERDDRRLSRRYQLELEAEFVVKSGKRVMFAGSGRCCNMSSSGLLLAAKSPVAAESRVIAAIRWPGRSPDGHPLLLVVSGRVVWSKFDRTAIAISAHTFVPENHYRLDRGRVTAGVEVHWIRRRSTRVPAVNARGPIVLVVESEGVFRIFKALLTRLGFTVCHTTTEAAIQTLLDGQAEIRLLITNRLEEFRTIADTVPILLLTDKPGQYEAAGAGMPHCELVKPFLLRDALSAAHRMTRQSRDV